MACATVSSWSRIAVGTGHGRAERSQRSPASDFPRQLPIRAAVHASRWTENREGLRDGRRRHLHGAADAARFVSLSWPSWQTKTIFSLLQLGWASAYTIEAILMQFAASLVKGQGRICRKQKANKEFNRRTAEEAFRSLVKTHDKYGWITPSLSDG